MIMYRWLLALAALYLLGDPNLTYLASVATNEEIRDLILSGVLSLFITPWVVAQIDG